LSISYISHFNSPFEWYENGSKKFVQDGSLECLLTMAQFDVLKCLPNIDRFCGLVVRVSGYRYPEVPGSIPGPTRFSEK
jgi:hypothetical protein